MKSKIIFEKIDGSKTITIYTTNNLVIVCKEINCSYGTMEPQYSIHKCISNEEATHLYADIVAFYAKQPDALLEKQIL